MQKNNYFWLGVGLVLALLLGGTLLFLYPHVATAPGSDISTKNSEATGSTTTANLGGVMVTLPAGATLAVINTVSPPSLSGSIQISPSLPADAQAALRTQETALIAQLKNTPTRVDLWLQLGVDRKIGGDYLGAIVAWNYVTNTAPTSMSYVAYGDLGDLYQNFDTNYAKAETNYKAAIAINSHVIDYYANLYNLYRYDDNNPTAAADIVVQGLKANPNNPDLLQLQQQLQAKAQ